jgi:hypothetical protein
VEIRYTLTIREFKEAYGVMLRQASFRYRFYYWNFTWLGLSLGMFLLGLVLLILCTPNANQPLLFLLTVIALANMFAPLRYRGLIRRNYRMQNLGSEISVALGPEGVTVRRTNKDITTRYGWSAIERFSESKDVLVLFPTRLQFIPIPKRVMTPGAATGTAHPGRRTRGDQRSALMPAIADSDNR